jgi:hypothetical protein
MPDRVRRPRERGRGVVDVDDPVALEDGGRLVTGDTHRHDLIDAGRGHVPDRRAAKIVEQQPGLTGGGARPLPGLREALDLLPAAVEDQQRR